MFADNDAASWLTSGDGWQNSDFDFGASLLSQGEEFPALMEGMDDFTEQLLKAADSNEVKMVNVEDCPHALFWNRAC